MQIRKLAVCLPIALAALPAFAAPVIDGFVSAATPTQEKTNPTIATGLTPTCVGTFYYIASPIATAALNYKIRCNNITAVTMAHIHGPADADNNANIMVALFTGPTTGDVNGILATGSIKRATYSGGTAAFDDLIAKMRTDQTYMNVHTTANTGGEVRGQISGIVTPKNPGLIF
jgi:hypothetical protein